jgi:hypothetical protein
MAPTAERLRLAAVLDLDVELPGLAGDLADRRGQVDRDPVVRQDLLDQVGGTHGLEVPPGVLRRELLVILGRPAAELLVLLDELDGQAEARGLERRGQTGDAATDDHDGLVDRLVEGLGDRGLAGPGAGHPHVVGGQHLRVLGLGLLRPGDTLADVGPRHERAGEVEGLLHRPGRAGTQDDGLGAFLDVLPDQLDALGRAEPRMGLAGDDLTLLVHEPGQGVHVDGVPDAAPAADVAGDLLAHGFTPSRCCRWP